MSFIILLVSSLFEETQHGPWPGGPSQSLFQLRQFYFNIFSANKSMRALLVCIGYQGLMRICPTCGPKLSINFKDTHKSNIDQVDPALNELVS